MPSGIGILCLYRYVVALETSPSLMMGDWLAGDQMACSMTRGVLIFVTRAAITVVWQLVVLAPRNGKWLGRTNSMV